MSQDKLQLVFQMKELKDPQCVEMLAQFMQYLMQNQTNSSGGTGKRNSKNSSKKNNSCPTIKILFLLPKRENEHLLLLDYLF